MDLSLFEDRYVITVACSSWMRYLDEHGFSYHENSGFATFCTIKGREDLALEPPIVKPNSQE